MGKEKRSPTISNEDTEESKRAKIDQEESESMLVTPASAIPSPVAQPPRLISFTDIADVLITDVVYDNLPKFPLLFKSAGWESRIKPNVLDRIVEVFRDTIRAGNLGYTEAAKRSMWFRSPVLSKMSFCDQYAIFAEVAFNMKAIFACLADPKIYYRLLTLMTEMHRNDKSATQSVTCRLLPCSRIPEPKHLDVYLQQLQCYRGVQYAVKDKGLPDYSKTNLCPSQNEESLNFMQAWNWKVEDLQIISYYRVNEEKADAYLALPPEQKVQYEKPSAFDPMKFFPPYNFDFEELRHLRNIDVLEFTGVPSTSIFDSSCTFPPTDEGEINMVRKFYYRKLNMFPIKKKDQPDLEPITFMVIPKVPVLPVPTLPRNATPKDIENLQKVQETNAVAYDKMRVIFHMEFRNHGKKICIPSTHYPPNYDIRFGAPVGTSAPNPGSRARAEAEPEGYFAKLIWKMSENKEDAEKMKLEAMKEFEAIYIKDKNKKDKEITVIEFNAPLVDTARQDAAAKARSENPAAPKSNFIYMKPAFLHNTLMSVKMSLSIGDQSNETDGTKFNNKPFNNCLYIVGTFVSERSNEEEQQEANDMA